MQVCEEKQIIKYQIQKESKFSCENDFRGEEPSEVMEFSTSLNTIFKYARWDVLRDIRDEDVADAVKEYLYNTITFYEVPSFHELILLDGELQHITKKVREEIKRLSHFKSHAEA